MANETAASEAKSVDPRQDEVVALYRSALSTPTLVSGDLRATQNSLTAHSKWRIVDMDMEKAIFFRTAHQADIASIEKDEAVFRCVEPAVEVNESILSTTVSRGLKSFHAVHKEITKGEKKIEFVEIWNSSKRLAVYDIETTGLHGKMITKGMLGSTEWSRSEAKYLFVAEKKVPKPETFFCKKPAPDTEPGTKFRLEEDWGEQMEGVCTPVVVVLDLVQGQGGIELKPQVIEMKDVSLGQAVFTPDEKGVVLVGVPNTPYRLGLKFCRNRVQRLYYFDLESKTFTEIGETNKHIFSPRFTATGSHIIYLQNEPTGSHRMAAELIMMEWATKTAQKVVAVPDDPKDDEFPGIYTESLLRHCTSSDGKTLYLSSEWHSTEGILEIDLTTGNVIRVTQPADERSPSSCLLLSVNGDHMLAVKSSPIRRPVLMVGKILKTPTKERIKWIVLDDGLHTERSGCDPLTAFRTELMKLQPDDNPTQYFEATFSHRGEKSDPVIVLLHGGPHSNSIAVYSATVEFLLRAGFSLLTVNYRGSTGFGEKNLRSLPGKVGDVDVRDVQKAVNELKQRGLSTGKALLLGGSHGGFLVGHLAGQYPSSYSACCLLNPVTDLSMWGPSDIPDWYLYEGGCEPVFRYDSLPSGEDLEKLRACSPIAHAHKITAPCHFFLGSADLRVDKGQGLRMYRNLLSRGVECRCNLYSDNHSLSKVPHNADVFISVVRWFDRVCRPNSSAKKE